MEGSSSINNDQEIRPGFIHRHMYSRIHSIYGSGMYSLVEPT